MQTLLRVGIAACLTLFLSWQGFTVFADGMAVPGAPPHIGQIRSGLSYPPQSGGGGTLTFGIDGTNYVGQYSSSTLAAVCPSSICTVSGSTSTPFGIGTASSNRVVVIAFTYVSAGVSASGQITGVRVNGTASGGSCTGGTAGTLAADGYTNTGNDQGAAIWYAAVPTGTTATVCFTAVGGNGWGNTAVVTVAYLTDTLGASHISVSSSETASPPGYPGSCTGGTCTNSSGTLTVPSGGIGVAVGYTATSGSVITSSWSGTASPTKQVETPTGNDFIVSPLATFANSGVVTETVVTPVAAGWSGAVFAP